MATFSDSFAGTALSSDWATRRGTFVVASNNFYGSTNGASFAEVATATADFSDDHSAQVTYTAVATSDYAGPAVRVSASGCYAIRADGFSSSSRRIVKVDSAGTVTAIGTVNIQPTTSDTVKLEVSGTTITAYKNGSQVDQVTDSTYSTGQPGIFYFRDNNGVTRCGSFSAADVASGPTLTDVDTDETIVPGQTGVVATGTNLSDGASARWVDVNTNVLALTNYSAHATAPTFDVPSLATTLAAGVKFGSGTFEILDGGSVSVATLAVALGAPSGWQVHDVTDISQAADEGCLYYGLSPAVVVGDQILLSSSVSIDSQGFLEFPQGVTSINYYVFDETDDTWGAMGVFSVLGYSAPGGLRGTLRSAIRSAIRSF